MAGLLQYDIDISLFKSISYLRMAVLEVVKKLELDIPNFDKYWTKMKHDELNNIIINYNLPFDWVVAVYNKYVQSMPGPPTQKNIKLRQKRIKRYLITNIKQIKYV
jgi:hypothetical protein